MKKLSNLKKSNQLIIILVIVWYFLSLIFAIYDQTISKTIVIGYFKTEEEVWGNEGAWYGDNGHKALMILSFVIIIGSFFKNLTHQRISAYVAIILCALEGYRRYLTNDHNEMTEMFIAIIFILVLIVLSRGKDWRRYIIIACSFIILIFTLSVIDGILKALSGRARPYQVNSGSAVYTPWYIFGVGNGTSFPSTHVSISCSFLPLLFFIKEKNITKELKIVIGVGVISWIMFVAISRIILGKHYPSDVLFPIMIASIIIILLYKLFYEKNSLFNHLYFHE